MDLNGLNKACQSGDNAACGRLLPTVEAECARKNGSACGFAGFLYERGRGVAVNAAMAASLYNQSCDAGDKMGGVGFALLQASGKGVIQDEAKARASLSQLCQEDVLEACMQLAVLIVPGGKPADIAHARELLTKACDGKHERACALLKSMPMMRPK
jgi:TPR repeat protein